MDLLIYLIVTLLFISGCGYILHQADLEGEKERNIMTCEQFKNESLSSLPLRCYDYYHIDPKKTESYDVHHGKKTEHIVIPQ